MRFDVGFVDAVVADVRVGHGHDLARVRGVGQNLLVAGHRRVEDDFAADFRARAERAAGKHRAVTEDQFRGRHAKIRGILPCRSPQESLLELPEVGPGVGPEEGQLIRLATTAALTPLSMFTTATLDAHAFSIASSGAIPPAPAP